MSRKFGFLIQDFGDKEKKHLKYSLNYFLTDIYYSIMDNSQSIAELQHLVDYSLQQAKQQGATAAEVGLSLTQGLSVSARLAAVETIEYDCDQGLSVTVYLGQHKGSASSSDLSPSAIQRTVSAACSIAKFSTQDPYSGLPDADLLATEFIDLDLDHPWNLSVEQAIELAINCETAAREGHAEIVNSEGASVNSHRGISILGNSLGFLQTTTGTRHSISCAVIGERDQEMQRGYWYSVARDAQDLESVINIGQKAAMRTLQKLGTQKLTTRVAPVLFSAEIAGSLISAFIQAISGGNIYRKTSFLLDRLDTAIFPDFIQIYERPFLTKALGSACFDAEGVATQNADIICNGILQHYLLSSYSARKLGVKSNGHAGGIHNLIIESGHQNFNDLLSQLDTGLLVTELMGQGVNRVTGDYSRGAAGFWVENGKIQYPVDEITIAGNLKTLFQQIIAVGNDVEKRGNIYTGSILIEQMSIAGQN
ncbi:MAG: metalloprotease PmbA [Pseudomonadota bacterium]